MKTRFILLLSICALSSCAVLPTVTQKQTRSFEPTSLIYTTPLVVDVEPIGDEMVSHTAYFGSTNSSNTATIEALKVETLAQANESCGADILVAPTYTITYTPNSVAITVSGFPAKYTKLRKANSDDDYFIKRVDVK